MPGHVEQLPQHVDDPVLRGGQFAAGRLVEALPATLQLHQLVAAGDGLEHVAEGQAVERPA